MLRSIEDWKAVLSKLSAEESARRILGDLTHYYHGRAHESEDIKQLANALVAYWQVGVGVQAK